MLKMKQEIENLIKDLCKVGLAGKYGKPSQEKHVKVWVRDGFHCIYCGEYLLADRIRLTSAKFDHILPKSQYKWAEELEDNQVLSCFCCNQIMRAWDPLSKFSDEVKENINKKNFGEYRNQLIDECRNYLINKLADKDKILFKSKLVISSKYRIIHNILIQLLIINFLKATIKSFHLLTEE